MASTNGNRKPTKKLYLAFYYAETDDSQLGLILLEKEEDVLSTIKETLTFKKLPHPIFRWELLDEDQKVIRNWHKNDLDLIFQSISLN